MLLEQQKVVVIGGASGIGRAVAANCYALGAHVVVAGRSEAKVRDVAKVLGERASALVVDTTSDVSVDAFADAVGDVDHLVVTASAVTVGAVRHLELSKAFASMDSKFWGPYRVARRVHLRPEGSIVFISGALSRRPQRELALLGAINAAVEALARGLALELSPVRVNTVSPGLIDTEAYDKMGAEQRRKHMEGASARVPVGRAGRPEEAAAAVVFALTNAFVTGAVIDVDGGAQIA